MKRVGRAQAYIYMAAIAASLILCHPAYGEVEIYDLETTVPDSTMPEDGGITEESLPSETAGSPVSEEDEPEEDEPEEIVEEVRMKETIYSDTGLYEEAIKDQYLFQTNVSNGGVTDYAVYFEIPSEITAVVTREGMEVPYVSGDQLNEPGSYVVNFSVTEQVSEILRKEYRSIFRFKIREEKEQDSNDIEPELQEPDTETSGILTLDEEEGDRELPAITGYYTETPQTFIHLFTNGVKISSSIPNGAITSKEVNLKIVGDAPFSVCKDDETIEWENGMILQAAGNYTVITGKETFSFRISRYFTKSRWFYAPEGFQIKQVNFNNNMIMIHDTDRFQLNQDGVYEVQLLSDSGTVLPCSFEKDSSQPEFTVKASKGGTAVEFQSTDIEAVQVYKDGKEIRPAYNYVYNDAGVYRIICFDHAGNFEEKDFEVPFKFNTFSILLILLTIGIIVVLIGTVFVTKNKFKIR